MSCFLHVAWECDVVAISLHLCMASCVCMEAKSKAVATSDQTPAASAAGA